MTKTGLVSKKKDTKALDLLLQHLISCCDVITGKWIIRKGGLMNKD